MISAATKEIKNLTVTEGGNITIPAPVVVLEFTLFESNDFAMVDNGGVVILDKMYTNRLYYHRTAEEWLRDLLYWLYNHTFSLHITNPQFMVIHISYEKYLLIFINNVERQREREK